MKKTYTTIVAAALILLANPTVQADTAEQKLGRGLADIGFGFLEIPAKLNKRLKPMAG